MFYRVSKEDGYIYGVVQGVNSNNSNITEEEYNRIKDILKNVPNAPEGYYYRLKENCEWELCEMPQIEETATEQDYLDALAELGVNTNEENNS